MNGRPLLKIILMLCYTVLGLFCNFSDDENNELSDDPRFLTQPFPVDQDTLSRQFTHNVASFPNGQFIVVWNESYDLSSEKRGIFGQRFLPNGIRIGMKFQVVSEANPSIQPTIATFADGRFIVGDGNGVQIFDAQNHKIGNKITFYGANIIIQDESKFLLYSKNRYQFFSSNGELLVERYTLYTNGYGKILPLKGDTYVNIFSYRNQKSNRYEIYGTIIDSALIPITDSILISTNKGGDQEYPDAAVINDQILCVWNGYFEKLYGKLCGATLSFPMSEILIDTENDDDLPPHVISLDNGIFVVSWISTHENWAVNCIEFDPSQLKITSRFKVCSDPWSYQKNEILAPLPDGKYVVVWTENNRTFARVIQSQRL